MKARALLLILLLALGLRLVALGSRPLWYDEAFSVLFSEKGLNAMLYGTLTRVNGGAAEEHPLLYYVTLDGWMRVFGQSPDMVRLYSVLLSLITIVMLYLLAAELFGERTGLAAALIAAVAPFYIQYSQEARMYALLGLLLVAATWCFMRGWRTGGVGYWIGFGILSGLSMHAQQLAGFYLAALGFVPVLARRPRQIIRTALAAGLALLIYLPWLINLPTQLGKISNYWILRPAPVQPLVTLWSFVFADIETRQVLVVVVSLLAVALLVVFLAYRAWSAIRRHTPDRAPLLFTLWLAAAPILLMWLVSQWRPVYLTRGLLPSGLMLYLALAWLLTRARLPRPILGVIAIPWAATTIAGLYALYTWNTFPRPPFADVDQFIAAHRQDGDQVVHANKLTMLPMVYYNRTLAQSYIRDVPGSSDDTLARPTQETLHLLTDECITAAARGSRRVWFVIFQRQIDEQNGVSPDLQWLDAHYRRDSIQTFNDLLVYLYDQPDGTARTSQCEASS